ncbi:phage tail spike protein [Lacticaseibacillus paracasei]|uniref:phage tail spike protein n=1 Tax=Lacticaseibacillus paracasei TaxID=1597 RepID=UPI002625A2DC|nr:phage tail spike protein [Lacticaseibacillus paracasei]MDN4555186.1 phage tail spike protein [Lacticaseibacillus paracasei]
MDYYFTDRKFNVLGIASTDGDGHWHVSADSEVQSTDDRPAVALTLTISFQTDQEKAIDEMAAENNFVLYQDEQGDGHQMVIASINHDTLTHIHTVVCTDAGNDLMNVVVNSYKADKAYTIADYILQFTSGSGWEIGTNDFTDNTRTLEWDDTDTALNRIKSVADDFGAVLSFGFSFVGTTVVRRVINIKQEDTTDSNVFFYMNKDINNLVKSVDVYDMETAVYGTGATPDGSDTPINLVGYSWTDPDGRYVLGSDGVLRDTVAVQQYSYLISNGNPTPTSGHWERFKSFDSNSQATLLQAVLADLKQYNHPNVNYEIDLVNAPYVPLNQTVHIADENQNLFLSAKVLSIERSRAERYTKITLGDYLTETSQVDAQLQAMADQLKNMPKAVQYYPWIRYADDDQGTNMSAFPANKKYMAVVYSNKSSVPSDDPADYAGKWALIQGADGADGQPGPAGTSSYLHTAYANSIDGSQDFSTTDGNGRSYFGQYVDQTQADSTDPTKYSWALFKGADGRDGKDGSDNVPVITVGAEYPSGPKKGDMHWLTDSSGVVTGYYTYDGSAWNPYKIDAKILSAETFNGMTFNGVTFTGSKFISSFSGVKPDGTADFSVHGTTTMADGSIVTDTYSDTDNTQITHVVMDQFGYLSNIYNKGTLMASTQMSLGMLTLGSNYQETASDPLKWITSSLDALKIYQLNNVSNSLWQGVSLLGWSGDAQSVTPSKKITDCLNGWKLVWGAYSNGSFTGTGISESEISKTSVIQYPGAGRILSIMNYANANCSKYVYAFTDHIAGNTKNSDGAAGNLVLVGIYEY